MAQPDREIWSAVVSHLRTQNAPLCRQWFDELEPLGIDGGVFRVRAATAVHRDYLQRQCLDAFNSAVQAATGRLIGVRFLGPDDIEAEPARASFGQPGPAGPGVLVDRRDGLVINPDYGFSNFVVGSGNRLAHAAAQAIANKPGRAYNPLFIHGGVGLGKTHLLQAICLRIAEVSPSAEMYYTSCEGFVTQFIEAVQRGEMVSFRHKFRDVDVLVVDDIHFLAGTDRTQEEFFHTFNSLYQASKQIVLSSDARPEEIPDLEERLVSRFRWGLVAPVEPPDVETRIAIVRTKAALRGLDLGDGVAEYIATRIATNIRELEGAVTRIHIQATVQGTAPDLALVKLALGDADRPGPAEPGMQRILGLVTEFYGVRLADLLSRRRQRSIALPRQVCMYLARKHTRRSFEEIGLHFGGRDHTTVMHALKAVDLRRRQDSGFNGELVTLERKLLDSPV